VRTLPYELKEATQNVKHCMWGCITIYGHVHMHAPMRRCMCKLRIPEVWAYGRAHESASGLRRTDAY